MAHLVHLVLVVVRDVPWAAHDHHVERPDGQQPDHSVRAYQHILCAIESFALRDMVLHLEDVEGESAEKQDQQHDQRLAVLGTSPRVTFLLRFQRDGSVYLVQIEPLSGRSVGST